MLMVDLNFNCDFPVRALTSNHNILPLTCVLLFFSHRTSFIPSALVLWLVLGSQTAVSESSDPAEPMCYDWGESSEAAVHVLVDESGFLSCPLFSHPSVYNYSSTQSAGHNLFWYRALQGHDIEQPITNSARISKDRDRLWLQPANANDTGQYICMLRNKTTCSKIAMRLTVLRPEDVARGNSCAPAVAVPVTQEVIPFQNGKILDCPDAEGAAKMADGTPTVSWVHLGRNGKNCVQFPVKSPEREVKGLSLQVHIMTEFYQGLYFCSVHYQRRGQALSFTRAINVTAVNPTKHKEPTILQPTKDYVFNFKQDEEARLVCTALFPYLISPWEIWWTVDGKTVEQLNDPRFSKTASKLKEDYGDRTEQSVLIIQDFQREDLNREFNCSVRNDGGNKTVRAQLKLEASLPSLELGFGLGVTLFLMLLLFVVYHVFWLELLLLYRSWFGTDERHTDDKEFDVYISYARNSEEEHFVLSTLRSVLENELGYSVCIFDRDSLPGGTITDETLSFVARSRRLLVVVSPGYASQGSQALLELKAGIDGMALGGHLRVILVQYRPVKRKVWVRELRRARVALALVRWQGDKSKELTSRFWKRLRVELPLRQDSGANGAGKDVALMRMSSQNSTSSQTGLLSTTTKSPQNVYNYAA
ncbi:interleukin-1 receptor accessory protein-like [Eucyclogobius newberryi]|uniref:interleukin-1 receptor accessory protein-like n=1 Tax=Eucyclogobius newberryi TaxID=166745 RepID=UPI003B5BA828